jgi:hypothetical protein
MFIWLGNLYLRGCRQVWCNSTLRGSKISFLSTECLSRFVLNVQWTHWNNRIFHESDYFHVRDLLNWHIWARMLTDWVCHLDFVLWAIMRLEQYSNYATWVFHLDFVLWAIMRLGQYSNYATWVFHLDFVLWAIMRLGQYSNYAAGWKTQRSDFESSWSQELSDLSVVQTGSGALPASYQTDNGDAFPRC